MGTPLTRSSRAFAFALGCGCFGLRGVHCGPPGKPGRRGKSQEGRRMPLSSLQTKSPRFPSCFPGKQRKAPRFLKEGGWRAS